MPTPIYGTPQVEPQPPSTGISTTDAIKQISVSLRELSSLKNKNVFKTQLNNLLAQLNIRSSTGQ